MRYPVRLELTREGLLVFYLLENNPVFDKQHTDGDVIPTPRNQH